MIKKRVITIIFTIFFIFFLPLISAQANYNSPFKYEPAVPKVEGLEVKGNADVDLFTGAATYNYPIFTPPGTNGLKPNLAIKYNSHSIGDVGSIGSGGWSLTQNYIQRDVNNTPEMTQDDKFILVLDSISNNLVYSSSDLKYHPNPETFDAVYNISSGQNEKGIYWVLKTKDGTSYRFGFYNFSETASNQRDYIWRWYLDLVNDTYGNSIFYNYSENPYSADVGAVYLNKIQYNNDKKREIRFDYSSQNRLDMRENYTTQGHVLFQSRMLEEIDVVVNTNLVRRYSFTYRYLDTPTTIILLSNITEFGSDNMTSLPSAQFDYEPINAGWNAIDNNTWVLPECFAAASFDRGLRLVDFNRDGLIDIAKGEGSNGCTPAQSIKKAWVNNGSAWIENDSWITPTCLTENGQDTGARFEDINGDGLTDFMVAAAYPNCNSASTYVYFNNGTGWEYNDTWKLPYCFTINYLDSGLRTIELNGDGKIDLVRSFASVNCDRWAWINNGTGWEYNDSFLPPTCIVYNSKDLGVRIADINGDGLDDFLQGAAEVTGACTVANKNAWINNGTGWIQDTSWNPPECFSQSYAPTQSYEDLGSRLADVNGDGLIDFIKGMGWGACNKDAWINNGQGWTNNISWSPPNCFASEAGEFGVRLVDINADGLADVIEGHIPGSTPPRCNRQTYINNASQNNSHTRFLKQIKTEFGGTISIKYSPSTNLDNGGDDGLGDLGFNIWVVSNITYNNSLDGPHNKIYLNYYNYSKGFYNYTTKEFGGFGYVQEIKDDKKINHYFNQLSGLKGKEFQTEILNKSDSIYQITQKQWSEIIDGGVATVTLSQEAELIYDGSTTHSKISNKSYAYDSFGNVVYIHTKGDIYNANDDYYEYFTYSSNSDKWIVNTIQNYTLFDSDNSTKLRKTNYSYDELAYGLTPEKGGITFKEEAVFGGISKNVSYQYDSFGNIVNQTDSKGNKVNYSYGVIDTSNTFVDSTTNSKGFKTRFGYDLGTGNLFNQTSSNGFFSNFTYDFLAIDKQKILPLDNLPTQEYSYSFQTVGDGKIIVKQREQNGTSNTIDTYKFYDGFGKLIQSKTESVSNKQVVVDYYYDDSGRIIKQSNPYFVIATQNYTLANASVPFILYQYDPLGRVVKVFNPDNSVKNITFYHWNITLYDEKSHQTKYEVNFRGNILKVIENNGSGDYTTGYEYNSAGELIFVNDSMGNNFNFTYDSLGRKTKEKDQDRGLWNYSYDSEGNLIKQFDNRNISVSFVYDSLNRKLNESNENDWVRYVYDADLNMTLSDVLTNISVVNYSYDNRLRKTQENVNLSNQKYSSLWNYDSADRVTYQIMPDGKIINFTYDEQGLLSHISGMGNINYNENNNPLNITYNNSLVTEYSYNYSNFRLSEIKTSNKQRLNYLYDSVGNVLAINDNVHIVNYSMTYDNLNRLASTSITGGSFNIFLGFVYDQIGNIRNVTGTNPTDYYYQDTRPHATSRVVYY
ncbi:VCBS repeat-containing protein [Candidatus Pacearchaeota archaeon]|nr:VCBS repeat-containing protein [Candidatus Pacearchaeota archaeon]